jgi:hypothetical protein
MFTLSRFKTIGITLIIGFTGITLAWDQYHGGVPVHHLLMDKEMPGISNWWGLLILPLFGWITLHKMELSLSQKDGKRNLIRLFAFGFLTGITIAIAFVNEANPVLENVPYGLLLIALCCPVYHSAFMLGFVIAMFTTFGPVIPVLFICVVAIAGWVIYQTPRYVYSKLRKKDI